MVKEKPYFNRHIFVGLFVSILFFGGIQPTFLKWDSLNTERPPLSFLSDYSAAWVKLVSGGTWPMAVDALWIQTLGLIGSGQYPRLAQDQARHFYRLANELDPAFFELYEQGGVFFGFFLEDSRGAQEILKRGIAAYETGTMPPAYWRRPFALYLHLAYVQAYLDQDWAQAKQTFLRASQVPNAPLYLSGMSEWLKKESGERELAVRVLKVLIQTTADETLREKYRQKLEQYQ